MTIQFFAVGQEATGVIAVGQMATGVIAIGQGATGFIAIGQMARGVVAVGMLSVGVVSVGMLSFGLAYSIGMIGAGGKAGGGAILPLVPILPKRPKLPGLGSLAAIKEGRGSGWLRGMLQRLAPADATFRTSGADRFVFLTGGESLPLTLPPALFEGATTAADQGIEVLALVERHESALSARRLMRAATTKIDAQWLAIAAAQLLGLAIGAYLYFQFVVVDLVDMLITFTRGFA